MDYINLEDLLEFYPSPDTEGFQTLISSKKEFSELKPELDERLPEGKGFHPFKHQKFTQRFLRVYDNLLILSETGTGKSCEVLGFTEFVLKEIKKMQDPRVSHFKKFIILVKNKIVKNEIRYQLACKCSDGHYVEQSDGFEKRQKFTVNTRIKQANYEINTYTKFARIILKYPDNQEGNHRLIEEYSHTIFWIDEAHNLIYDEKEKQKPLVYEAILRVFRKVPNIKRIVSTATPMINKESEILYLINLLLPKERELPSDFDFNNATLRDLEPYFRGRVSYIRSADIGVIPEEQGEYLSQSYVKDGLHYSLQSKLYKSYMSDFQTAVYNNNKESGQYNFYNDLKQISNFVFPDGSWGVGTREDTGSFEILESLEEREPSAFKKYVIVKPDNSYEPSQEFKDKLKNLDDIKRYSCKFASIIELVINEPGTAFVYSDYVNGSGIIVLSLCFEVMNFVRYKGDNSVFISPDDRDTRPFCIEKDYNTNRRIRDDFIPKSKNGPYRYALLTDSTTSDELNNIMEIMNSYENRHGDYIKVLISSRVGREGININNIRQIHLVGPEWNQTAIHQAISRGIRATSHLDLLKELQEVKVKIYKHVAIPKGSSDIESIDAYVYCEAEYKDRKIKRIMRFLKQCAVGCHVFYERNVRATDKDYSPACDYDICKYKCADDPPGTEDYSTFNLLYSEDTVNKIIGELVDLFRKNGVLTLEEITTLLPNYQKTHIVLALERIIIGKIPMYDCFGFRNYLHEDKGTFYLLRSYYMSVSLPFSLFYYTNLIGVKRTRLPDVLADFELSSYKPADYNLMNIDVIKSNKISIEVKSLILEDSIYRKFVLGNPTNFDEEVIRAFSHVFYTMNEPVTEINRYQEKLTKTKKGRKPIRIQGKRRVGKINPSSVSKIKIIEENTEKVYLHTLFSFITDQTSYSFTPRINKGEGRIRLLKPSENVGWREVTEAEYYVYNFYIQAENIKRREKLESKKIYGNFFTETGKFFILDKAREESEKASFDSRKIKRGKVCINYSKYELIRIMYDLRIEIQGHNKLELLESLQRNRKVLIDRLSSYLKVKEENWSDDFVVYCFMCILERITKKDMCQMIKDKLSKDNVLQVY